MRATLKHTLQGLAAIAVALAFSPVATAAGKDSSLTQAQSTEIGLLRALVEQGVLTMDKARDMLRRAGLDPELLQAAKAGTEGTQGSVAPAQPGPASQTPPAPPLALPKATEAELIEQVRQSVIAQSRAEGRAAPGSLPPWLRSVSFGGDLRLRYLRNAFASDNSSAGDIDKWYHPPFGASIDTLGSRNLLQLRARLDVGAGFDKGFSAGVRVVTAGGNDATASPVNFDVDLGRYGRPFSAAVSLAYLQWQPRESWRLAVGRLSNPYFKSDLIFAPDLSLDGVALGYAPRLTPAWGGFIKAGAHPLQTSDNGPFNAAADQWLYAAQSGVDWSGADESHVRLGVAYYDFAGIQGKPDPVNPANNGYNDTSAPLFRQFGNTVFDIRYQELNEKKNSAGVPVPLVPLYGYAAKFRLMNIGADFDFARFDPVRLGLQLDWVRNIGFNAAEIRSRLGSAIGTLPFVVDANGQARNSVDAARTNGYLVKLRAGAAALRHAGDWQIFGGARYLERDAVPDAFTSPDYRLGGTDNRAAFAGLNLGVSPATSITLRFVSARSIDAGPKLGVDTWFLDFNGTF